jgi:hypothetical protein
MATEKCFSDINELKLDTFNHKPFTLSHELVNHEAFQLDNLAKLISELPEKQVIFSKLLEEDDIGSDFFNDPKAGKYANKGSLETAIRSMESADAFISLINPHRHPLFEGVYKAIMAEIEAHLGTTEKNTVSFGGEQSWLFIASPNAITPFHYDPSSNFLFQIKGEKIVKVFPPRHPDILSDEQYEDVLTVGPPKDTGYRKHLDQLGQEFVIKSGDSMHIPFTSGHYVQNGADEISITYSLFFQTNETRRWFHSAYFNKKFRKAFRMLGMKVSGVGSSTRADNFKDFCMRAISKIKRTLRKKSS